MVDFGGIYSLLLFYVIWIRDYSNNFITYMHVMSPIIKILYNKSSVISDTIYIFHFFYIGLLRFIFVYNKYRTPNLALYLYYYDDGSKRLYFF